MPSCCCCFGKKIVAVEFMNVRHLERTKQLMHCRFESAAFFSVTSMGHWCTIDLIEAKKYILEKSLAPY